MGKLPKNWVECNIDTISIILDGKRKPVNSEERAKRFGNIPYYGATGQTGWIDDYIFDEELLLVGEDGAPFFDKLKNVAYIINGKSWVNNHAHVLKRINEHVIENKFLLHFFNQLDYTNYVGGTTRLKLNQASLKSIPFPLPPLKEQQRIVQKLDSLFLQLETIKTSMAKIPVLLKDFRHQVLTQAVSGKLTEEWRLINKLEKINLDNLSYPIEYKIIDYSASPSTWVVTALGNYANCSRGKFTPRPRNDPKYFDGIYPFMQIGDLPREGGITKAYSKTLNEAGKKISKNFEKDTVVIAIVGATIGNTGILNEEMYFPDSLIGINCFNRESNIFVEYFLRVVKSGLREISYSSGGQPNINSQVIRNLEISIPPPQEQIQIIKRIESLFLKADAIERQYQSFKQKIDNLPQAILHKAFKGELMEQLESDGDARELLKEIEKLKIR